MTHSRRFALAFMASVAALAMPGRLAAQGGRPITAPDVIAAIPDAIALVRRGGEA